MRMSYIVVAAAAAALLATAFPASAEQAADQRFERDGVTYVYKVTTKGERTFVSGRSFPDGKRFSLSIAKGKVSGVSGGMPVAFAVADASQTEVAAR